VCHVGAKREGGGAGVYWRYGKLSVADRGHCIHGAQDRPGLEGEISATLMRLAIILEIGLITGGIARR